MGNHMRCIRQVTFIALGLVLLPAADSSATWGYDGVSVPTTAGLIRTQPHPSGGVYSVNFYATDIEANETTVRVQWLDEFGNGNFGPDGIEIWNDIGMDGGLYNITTTTSPSGELWVFLHVFENVTLIHSILVYGVDANGLEITPTFGLLLRQTTNEVDDELILTDAADNVYVVWQQNLGGDAYTLSAQKLSAAGVVQWAAGGVLVASFDATDLQDVDAVADATDGLLVTWSRTSGGEDGIYAQSMASLIVALCAVSYVLMVALTRSALLGVV